MKKLKNIDVVIGARGSPKFILSNYPKFKKLIKLENFVNFCNFGFLLCDYYNELEVSKYVKK